MRLLSSFWFALSLPRQNPLRSMVLGSLSPRINLCVGCVTLQIPTSGVAESSISKTILVFHRIPSFSVASTDCSFSLIWCLVLVIFLLVSLSTSCFNIFAIVVDFSNFREIFSKVVIVQVVRFYWIVNFLSSCMSKLRVCSFYLLKIMCLPLIFC